MKLLFLTHTSPNPPDDGMRSTCYALLREMSKTHEVSLLSLVESDQEAKQIGEIRPWLKNLEVVKHDIPRSIFRRIQNILFENTPFCVVQFMSEAFAKKMRDLISKEKFDLVHFTSINISGYWDCLGNTPGLFFPHDSVSMQFHRNAGQEPNWLKKFYLYAQSRKARHFEKTMIPKFTKTVVVSEVDRQWILKFLPQAQIPVIPGGVDPERFKPLNISDDFPSVIFRGVMNFIPNMDTVLHFHKEILPLIRKEFPNLKFYVVGKLPPPEILALHDGKSVIVAGLVPSIQEYMAKATVNICPMRSGSGMKNKVLEAWAMERAVVASSIACDGIDISDEKDILVADEPQQFADAVIRLLKDPSLRASLGRAGREKCIRQYTWAYVATMFEKVYKEMAKQLLILAPIFLLLLSACATPEKRLNHAAAKGNAKALSALLFQGAEPNSALLTGETPLMKAAEFGHTNVVKLLIERGANVNMSVNCTLTDIKSSENSIINGVFLPPETSIHGYTALMFAAKNGHTDVVKLLLDNGADIHAKSMESESAHTLAKINGHADIEEILMKAETKLHENQQNPPE